MSNGELQQLEGLANLIDQVAKDCWNASRMNPQARTCEYAAKEIRSLITKLEATPSSANGAEVLPELPNFNWANENGALFDSAAMQAYALLAISQAKLKW